MGFTRYWRNQKQTSVKNFQEFSGFCKNLYEFGKNSELYQDIELVFEFDQHKPPVFDEEYIRFNGKDEDGHETFAIDNRNSDFDCCKTAEKPYDVYVSACLLKAHQLLGLTIDVDGDDVEWEDGQALLDNYELYVSKNTVTPPKISFYALWPATRKQM